MVTLAPTKVMPAQQNAPVVGEGLAEGSYDLALAELSPAMRATLGAADGEWMCSYAFCTLFFEQHATRVHFQVDATGRLARALYYREQSWGMGWTALNIYGPLPLTRADVLGLLLLRHAHIATISRMPPRDLHLYVAPWFQQAINRDGEDFVASIPSTVSEYLTTISAKMRKKLPNYTRRIMREFGEDYHVLVAEKTDITRDMVTQLIALNTARSLRKGLKPMWSEELIDLRWQLAQEQGLFLGIMKGDELVGGTLSYLHRHEAALAIIAHNPDYNYLHVGYVGLWLSIERMIAAGVRQYHFMWGRLRYKTDFGGEYVKFHDVTIFLNPLVAAVWRLRNLLPHLRTALHVAIHDRLKDEQLEKFRQFKRRLQREA